MASPVLTLHHPASARRYYADGLWQAESFIDLLWRHADERPDAPALRDSARRLSWVELRQAVEAAAATLAASDATPGARVSLWLSNRVEAVVALLACAHQGLVCNPSLHQNYTSAEVVGLLDWIGAHALIHEQNYGADAQANPIAEPANTLTTLRQVITLPPGRVGNGHFDTPAKAPCPARHDDPDQGLLSGPSRLVPQAGRKA